MSHSKMRVTCPVNLYVFPVIFKTKSKTQTKDERKKQK